MCACLKCKGLIAIQAEVEISRRYIQHIRSVRAPVIYEVESILKKHKIEYQIWHARLSQYITSVIDNHQITLSAPRLPPIPWKPMVGSVVTLCVRLSGKVSRNHPVKTLLFQRPKSTHVADTAAFLHYGISPWEIEVIYDTLSRCFEVEEKQVTPDDPQYVSMVEIGFPVPYNETFFQQEFTIDNWFKIKGVIKDVKKRRGRKGIKAFIRFAGFGNNDRKLVLFFPCRAKATGNLKWASKRSNI